MTWASTLAFVALVAASPGVAANLDLPANAVQSGSQTDATDLYSVASGPFTTLDGVPMISLEGTRNRTAWRMPSDGASQRDLLEMVQSQLQGQGFATTFMCTDRLCGGFDFRYNLPVLALPAMYVDLGDFRYLSAARRPHDNADPVELVAVTTSRTNDEIYIQIDQISATPTAGIATRTQAVPIPMANPSPAATNLPEADLSDDAAIVSAFRQQGHLVLDGLEFDTGSSRLGSATPPVLSSLARLLARTPDLRIALVGHTDFVGSLASNLTLSKARAQSVANALTALQGVAKAQVISDGVGYLSPVVSNETDAGRTLNRRVEAVFLSGTLPPE